MCLGSVDGGKKEEKAVVLMNGLEGGGGMS